MNAHLVKDLDKLKAQILRVAAAVEENVRKSVRALRELSAPLAEDVVYSDRKIDETEVETEEECLKILALHQPVASDLRFVITVLKINNELEHIGDMSANIARRVPFLLRGGKVPIPFDIDKMTSRTVYYDASGEEIALLRGRTLIVIFPDDAASKRSVSYE